VAEENVWAGTEFVFVVDYGEGLKEVFGGGIMTKSMILVGLISLIGLPVAIFLADKTTATAILVSYLSAFIYGNGAGGLLGHVIHPLREVILFKTRRIKESV